MTLADLKRLTLAARYGLPHTRHQADQINAWVDWSRRQAHVGADVIYPCFYSSNNSAVSRVAGP